MNLENPNEIYQYWEDRFNSLEFKLDIILRYINNQENQDQYLKIKDAAKLISVSRQTIHKWTRKGIIKKNLNGKISKKELLNAIQKGC